MKTRLTILESLIALAQPVETLRAELRDFPWDSEKELIELMTTDLLAVLQRYISGNLTTETVADWANAIEGQDDIGFEASNREIVREVLTILANPDLHGGFDRVKAVSLLKTLGR